MMMKHEILRRAALRFTPLLKELPISALTSIGSIIEGIYRTSLRETEKRAAISRSLTDIYDSKRTTIGGNQQPHLRQVIDAVYAVRDGTISNPDLEGLNCGEIYLYHKYFERMHSASINMKAAILEREIQRKHEEEFQAMAAHEEMLTRMSPIEKLVYEIENTTDENRVVSIFQSELNQYEGDDQRLIAGAIRAYWQRNGKWEGKLSDKQKKKVDVVRRMLT